MGTGAGVKGSDAVLMISLNVSVGKLRWQMFMFPELINIFMLLMAVIHNDFESISIPFVWS